MSKPCLPLSVYVYVCVFLCVCTVHACVRVCVCVRTWTQAQLNHLDCMSDKSHACTLPLYRLAKPKTVLKYATWALNKDQGMAVKVGVMHWQVTLYSFRPFSICTVALERAAMLSCNTTANCTLLSLRSSLSVPLSLNLPSCSRMRCCTS